MGKSDRLSQVFIQLQRLTNRAGDLCYFQRMGESGTVIIAFMIDKHLSFIFQPSESRGVDDTIAISLEPSPVLMLFFRVLPAPTISTFHGIGCQRGRFQFFQINPFDHFFANRELITARDKGKKIPSYDLRSSISKSQSISSISCWEIGPRILNFSCSSEVKSSRIKTESWGTAPPVSVTENFS